MSVDLSWFDGESTPDASFEPLPAGDYLAIIVDSEKKATKAGNGEYIELKLEVIEGEYQNRNLWERLTVDHPNETAQKIGRSRLKEICRAVGNMAPRDSSELHDIPMIVTVGHEKRKDTGEMTNRIKGYKSRSAPAAAKPATASKAPWKKGA
jgi:hypothetical protein